MPSVETPALKRFPSRWIMTDTGMVPGVHLASSTGFFAHVDRYQTCRSGGESLG